MADPIEKLREIGDEYRSDTDDDRPLAAYTGLLSTYALATGTMAVLGRRRLPGTLAPADLALGSVATFKLARTLTKEPITSPLRAPFARFEHPQGPGEIHEDVRGRGWRHAVGELLTCPFCVAQWTATALVAGMTVFPRATRTFMSILAMVTAADVLQFAYAQIEQSVEG